jgi:hypothetical protein
VYTAQDLYVLRDRALQHADYSIFRARSMLKKRFSYPVFVSYGIFQDLNTKSKLRTVEDIFARFLLKIKGISPPKARAIIAIYPVLRS